MGTGIALWWDGVGKYNSEETHERFVISDWPLLVSDVKYVSDKVYEFLQTELVAVQHRWLKLLVSV